MTDLFSTRRRACVLLPLFSVRREGDWGVGDIRGLGSFCQWAGQAGFDLVQLLPFHEVWRGESSPYSALTAFALDPVYVALDDCEDFAAAGGEALLSSAERDELAACRDERKVNWRTVRKLKETALWAAFDHFERRERATASQRARAFADFAGSRASWLDDYALYWALANQLGPNWMAWPAPLRAREPAALAEARTRLARPMAFRRYAEWLLDTQWEAMRRQARDGGVDLAGDLPFVISRDGADVWARQGDFHLDLRLGVPPDAFSADGQDWGLPVYDWEAVIASGFSWMKARAARAAELCALWRVDHVIGLYRSYYRSNDGRPAAFTPPREEDQIRLGEAALAVLGQPMEIIAEDLGMVPPYLRPSLTRLGVPGFRVLRWEKDDHLYRDPATWPVASVAATGTHDTESLAEWYDQLPSAERDAFLRIPGLAGLDPAGRFDAHVRDTLLRVVYGAGSALAVLPFSDVMGTRERINLPGSISDANWTFRLPMMVSDLMADHESRARLLALSRASGRRTG